LNTIGKNCISYNTTIFFSNSATLWFKNNFRRIFSL